MVGNITVDGKPIQDVLEMKNHDDLIKTIIQMGAGELNISEKRIKEIHKGIIHEEDPEKSSQIGQWKRDTNYLYNYKNERFDFVAPSDVPERIHKLVNWINEEKEKIERGDTRALHPVLLAFQFHLEYITIHPFYDGNGRTARILTNIILISYGYPPLYIKTDEKQIYYQYLADIQGYGGEPDLFFEFMAERLIRSQEIVLNAAEGKSIEEPDDLDKRLRLIEKELGPIEPANEVVVQLERAFFMSIYDTWLSDLLRKSIVIAQKFNKFFSNPQHYIVAGSTATALFSDESPSEVLDDLKEGLVLFQDRFNPNETNVELATNYKTFIKGGIDSFNLRYELAVKFNKTGYVVELDEFSEDAGRRVKKRLFHRLLDQSLTEAEMDFIGQSLGDSILRHIDFQTKKLGLR